MRISVVTDSLSGSKYLTRAKSLARSINSNAGVKRQIIDGFIVEGRKAGRNRRASVIDLPGEINTYCTAARALIPEHISMPSRFVTPGRGVMLDAVARDDGPTLPLRESGRASQEIYNVGEAPPHDIYFFEGASMPVAGESGSVQTLLSRSGPPSATLTATTIDYRGTNDAGLLIHTCSRHGVPGNIWVGQEFLKGLFGAVLIPDSLVVGAYSPSVRATSFQTENKIHIAVLLRELVDEIGDHISLCFLTIEFAEGGHEILLQEKLAYNDLPSGIFKPHLKLDLNTYPASGPPPLDPANPDLTTNPGLVEFSMMVDSESIFFNAIVNHTIPASARAPDGEGGEPLWLWRNLGVSGLLRLRVGRDGSGIQDASITHINCDARASFDGRSLYDELEVVKSGEQGSYEYEKVSDYLDGDKDDWLTPSWVTSTSLALDDEGVIEFVGFANGHRRDSQVATSLWKPWDEHEVGSPRSVFVVDGTEYQSDNFTTGFAQASGNEQTIPPGEDGSYPDLTVNAFSGRNLVPIGNGGYEIQLCVADGGAQERAACRFRGGVVSKVPVPDGAVNSVSTCYEKGVELEDGSIIEHRSVVTFYYNGEARLESRVGDNALCEGVADDSKSIAGGAFYDGNPFSMIKPGEPANE